MSKMRIVLVSDDVAIEDVDDEGIPSISDLIIEGARL